MADETKLESSDSAEKAFAAASEAAVAPVKSEAVAMVSAKAETPVKVETPAKIEAPAKVEAVAFPPKSARTPAKKTAPAVKVAPVAKAEVAKPVAPVVVKKAAPPVAKKMPAAKPAAPVVLKPAMTKPVVAKVAASPTPVAAAQPVSNLKPVSNIKPVPTISQMKDKTMTKTTEMTEGFKKVVAETQEKAKDAFEKGKAVFGEAGEFTKGNVEAVVASGKILAAGMQGLGKTLVEEGKGAVETATADVKSLAAVKSPTEFVKLQGDIARRNIDTMISTGSKNAEAMIKLYSDAFAPISARFSLAMDKVKKAA